MDETLEKRRSSLLERSVELSLCRECVDVLRPKYDQKCLSCGAGIHLSSEALGSVQNEFWIEKCMNCRRSNFKFDRCYSVGNYEQEIREAILGIKSGTLECLIGDMAKLMLQDFSETKFDLIVPIPIHWRRRIGRRVVAAELLSEEVSRLLKTPRCRRALRYKRRTSKQGTLSTTERVKNLKGALEVRRPLLIQGKHVLIVDDVMTSGATLNEASLACLQAGAGAVSVAVIARGVGRSMKR